MRSQAMVTDINPSAVTVKRSDGLETIPCHTVIWAAGVQASFLGKVLAQATGAKVDRSGRVLVEPDLTLPGRPEIFVIGDLASYGHQTGKPLPGIAPVAIQEGQYMAKAIHSRVTGELHLLFATVIAVTWPLSEEHSQSPIWVNCSSPAFWRGWPGFSSISCIWWSSKTKSSF